MALPHPKGRGVQACARRVGAPGLRTAFVRGLMDVASRNPRIVLVTGDLGFAVLDDFRAKYPDRFYNVGVAEQNLAGVAAGLALAGHVVFTYSIGNFPTLR